MMRIRSFTCFAILAALSLTLAGCGKTLMDADDEARIGAEQHPHIIKEFGGVYQNAKLTAYVERVMQRIARASDKPEASYRITILDTPVVNAFALPGGYTYVTRGLLALASSEAELAGVIGHEIAHVTARHGARRHTATVGTQIFAGVVGAVLQAGTGIDAKATGGVVNLGGAALLAGYSRDNEYEADNLGIQAMARAGYRPQAQGDFLGKLASYGAYQAGGHSKANWLSTHPNNKERVAKAYAKAKARSTANSIYEGVDAHMAAIDGMPCGDQPSQGIIRGGQFSHADLRLRFRVPRGFSLRNSPQRVMAKHKNGVQIVFDMDERIALEPPEDYLQGGWADGADTQDLRIFKLAGRAAASGRVQTQDGVALLLAIPANDEQFLRFGVIAPRGQIAAAEAAMASLRQQIRFLSAAEAAAIQPFRLQVVTVAKGDTVYSLTRRMRGQDRQQVFRLLNNIGNDNRLTIGQPIKLIVD
ncbi:MAG: M48 family metalloprotease [Parvibaculales bacterium]